MSYTLNMHCKGAFSVCSSVRPSVSLSVGPSIGPFVGPSTGWMHRCLPVRLVSMHHSISEWVFTLATKGIHSHLLNHLNKINKRYCYANFMAATTFTANFRTNCSFSGSLTQKPKKNVFFLLFFDFLMMAKNFLSTISPLEPRGPQPQNHE